MKYNVPTNRVRESEQSPEVMWAGEHTIRRIIFMNGVRLCLACLPKVCVLYHVTAMTTISERIASAPETQ